MLGLTRLPGEAIRIGEDITVIIHRVKGRRVSVLIDAPQHVRIVRTELINTTPPTETEQE